MAAIEAHAVVERRFPLLLVLIAGIGQPAVRLQEHGRAEIFLAIPPVRGAGCRATGAQNAFVQPIELLAVCRALAVFQALFDRRKRE